jgi:predicted SnoaL-like aldol condensation-catalyzing enzyme
MKKISALGQAAGALAAMLLLTSCDRQQAAAPPPEATAPVDLASTLTPAENANLQTASAELPETARISHSIPDGPVVVLHYVNVTAAGPVAGIKFFIFVNNGAVSERIGVEVPSDPRIHLATPPAPASDESIEAMNRQTVQSFLQALTRNDVNAAAQQLAPNFVDHTAPEPTPRDAWIAQTRSSPQREFGLQHIAAWNSLVATYASVGIHQNGSVRWQPGYDVFRLENGLIAERWHVNY